MKIPMRRESSWAVLRICSGAQNAGRRPADRRGRDRRRASPASVSDRWRAIAGRHGWTPIGCQAGLQSWDGNWSVRAVFASVRALSPVTEAVRTSADQTGARPPMATGALAFVTTVMRRANATNQIPTRPTTTNEYQSVLASASGASQSASRILVILTSTPHALKMLKRCKSHLRERR